MVLVDRAVKTLYLGKTPIYHMVMPCAPADYMEEVEEVTELAVLLLTA
jgi:hypothetical protein